MRLIALVTACLLAATSHAGGGAENVLLVVNANSNGSKQVANHYTRARNVPASNVVALDYKGPKETISGKGFREQILMPVLEAIQDRKLGLQIDIVAYSTDFPWRVTLAGEYPKELKFPPQMRPNASLTGATYLYGFVLGKNPSITGLDTNWYFSQASEQPRGASVSKCSTIGDLPTRAFRSRYRWTAEGARSNSPKKGRRYLMATMLGVTTGRGNRVAEVIRSLDRAVEAEATPPSGTVYFMKNNDVRSKARHDCFEEAAGQIRRLGSRAVVKRGIRPQGAQDVAGLVMGAADLDLESANMKIQPGAICEHFTSAGGLLFRSGYQTPLTDLIRAGAVGASGTVEEPYAIQAKFPTPALQVHYRRGCSLAEAFYQSIAGPYQLLIVGDPLCQPWVDRPGLQVAGWPNGTDSDLGLRAGATSSIGFSQLGLTEGAEVSAKPSGEETDASADAPPGDEQRGPALLQITPQVTSPDGKVSGVWELFVDGRLRMRLPSGASIGLTREQLGPGWHDLRCVGIDSGPIEAQTRWLGELEVLSEGSGGSEVRLTPRSTKVAWGHKALLEVSAPGAEQVVIRHNSRQVGVLDGPKGTIKVPTSTLGRGPVRLQAVAQPSGARSPEVWIQVQ